MRGTSCRSLSDDIIFVLKCWSHFLFVFPLPSSSPSMLFSSSPCCHWSCWTLVSWYPSTDSEPIRLTICYGIKSRISSMVSKILLWSQPPSQSSLSISSVFRQSKYSPFPESYLLGFKFLILETNYSRIPFSLSQIIYIFISIERSRKQIH